MVRRLAAILCLLGLWLASSCSAAPAPALARRHWAVEGVAREALLYVPPSAKTNAAPVVFAFHGHGGSMNFAARSFGYHARWPEAIVVYMQGLNTPGPLTDPEGRKAGWQTLLGAQGDRDLKFFDVVLATLREEYKVDPQRIYATGHSNGGAFTYLLWAARGDVLAAVAPSGAVAVGVVPRLKPKPVLHVAGEKDELVKFAWQEGMIRAVRAVNQCGEGQPWDGEKGCTLYPSKVQAPVVTYIHPGPHVFPANAAALIVKFFQQH